MTEAVTVVIPVGPAEHHARWLPEALASVRAQTVPCEILVVDDMHGFSVPTNSVGGRPFVVGGGMLKGCYLYRPVWRLGVAHAFNAGVAAAPSDLAFMLGADDTLEPTCIERALETWEWGGRRDAYYYAGVRYMDTGEEQTAPCNAAMVTKSLWCSTGGFPIESAVGGPDCALVSILMVHRADALIPIARGVPLYNYRRHAGSDTAGRGPWQGPILESRDILTREWAPPVWGRYS